MQFSQNSGIKFQLWKIYELNCNYEKFGGRRVIFQKFLVDTQKCLTIKDIIIIEAIWPTTYWSRALDGWKILLATLDFENWLRKIGMYPTWSRPKCIARDLKYSMSTPLHQEFAKRFNFIDNKIEISNQKNGGKHHMIAINFFRSRIFGLFCCN